MGNYCSEQAIAYTVSSVFFLSVNAELSGKCCGNPVAFNFLTGFSNLTVTATVWGQGQGCGVLGELFSHPLSKYKI